MNGSQSLRCCLFGCHPSLHCHYDITLTSLWHHCTWNNDRKDLCFPSLYIVWWGNNCRNASWYLLLLLPVRIGLFPCYIYILSKLKKIIGVIQKHSMCVKMWNPDIIFQANTEAPPPPTLFLPNLKLYLLNDNANILFIHMLQVNNITYRFLSKQFIYWSAYSKRRLLHSKFLPALFKQKSEGPHIWFLQFGSLF